MMLVKCEEIVDGPGPSEKMVTIRTTSGRLEEVFVDKSFVRGDRVELPIVATEKDGAVLVELPSEASSGTWRIWVHGEPAKEHA